jgi:hypothetical protein
MKNHVDPAIETAVVEMEIEQPSAWVAPCFERVEKVGHICPTWLGVFGLAAAQSGDPMINLVIRGMIKLLELLGFRL